MLVGLLERYAVMVVVILRSCVLASAESVQLSPMDFSNRRVENLVLIGGIDGTDMLYH